MDVTEWLGKTDWPAPMANPVEAVQAAIDASSRRRRRLYGGLSVALTAGVIAGIAVVWPDPTPPPTERLTTAMAPRHSPTEGASTKSPGGAACPEMHGQTVQGGTRVPVNTILSPNPAEVVVCLYRPEVTDVALVYRLVRQTVVGPDALVVVNSQISAGEIFGRGLDSPVCLATGPTPITTIIATYADGQREQASTGQLCPDVWSNGLTSGRFPGDLMMTLEPG